MKIVIVGGTGLIGSKLVNKIREIGHEVVAASRALGVNTITGEGLNKALKNTEVVVDVSNSPSLVGKGVMDFFQTSTRNLLTAEAYAGVIHHVALSIVGIDRPASSEYFRAKLAQEKLIKESGIPYSILRSTQFFEFAGGIAQSGTIGQNVYISTGLIQPIAADEVVDTLIDILVEAPLNSTLEVAGPVSMRMADFINLFLLLTNDPRHLVADKHALYFGMKVDDHSLIPGDNAR